MRHFDLIVIGSGPAGEKGAAQAAYFGKRVAIIEREPHVGGAVINTGGVPSKTLRETALYLSGLRQRGLYDIDTSPGGKFTIENFMYRKKIVMDDQRKITHDNLTRHGIEVIQGGARFKDQHTVRVRSGTGTEELRADVFLIATGSSPLRPAHIPFDHELVYDSDEILKMNRIPATMLVVGGGAVGTEYASIFTALGVAVTLLEPHDRILTFLDTEIVALLTEHLQKLGLRFLHNDKLNSIEVKNGQAHITLESGARHVYETVLFAVGRQSNVQNLGLEDVGVALADRGFVKVNENYQTSVPNIYAAGDVIGFPALASTSMEQARVGMVHAFDLHYKETVSRILPMAVYGIPEVSAVGLTEDECKNKNIPYLVGRAYYQNSPRGQIIGDTEGMIKLVFSPADKRLLGAHIVGEQASELIHVAAQILLRGEPIDTFIEAVYNYPSLTDLYKYAAYDGLGKLEAWHKKEKAEQREI